MNTLQIYKLFDNWKNHTGKYSDLQLNKVVFSNVKIFERFNERDIFKNSYLEILRAINIGMNVDEVIKLPKGNIPVYSSAEKLIHEIEENLADKMIRPEQPLVSFANDGDSSAGTNFHIHNTPFYVQGKRNVILCNEKSLHYKYFYYACLNIKSKYSFNRVHNATKQNLEPITILLPKDCNGYSSCEIQVVISEFIDWQLTQKNVHLNTIIPELKSNISIYKQLILSKIFN